MLPGGARRLLRKDSMADDTGQFPPHTNCDVKNDIFERVRQKGSEALRYTTVRFYFARNPKPKHEPNWTPVTVFCRHGDGLVQRAGILVDPVNGVVVSEDGKPFPPDSEPVYYAEMPR